MNLSGKTDEELEVLGQKLESEEGLTEEERKALMPQDSTQNDSELVIEVTEDPKKPEDNGDAPPPEGQVDNPPPTTEPAKQPALAEDVYNSIIQEHPQLAKFKNDENFLTNLASSYVNLESKLGSPKPTDQPVPPPITDAQRLAEINKQIMAETERKMLSDSVVLDALTIKDEEGKVIEILPLPRTEKDIANMRRNYPAEFAMLYQRGKEINDETTKIVNDAVKAEAYAPEYNTKALDNFIERMGTYFKKLAPNATPDDLKVVGERLQAFTAKALPDVKYYNGKGKAFFLNDKMLDGDFLAETSDLALKFATMSATNGVVDKAKDAIKNVQKQTTIKTLASKGLNQGSVKKINLKDPRQMGQLSDQQLDKYEQELLAK